MATRRIIIRADGNKHIGFGHLYRCLAISSYIHHKFNLTLLTKYHLPEFILTEYIRYQVNVVYDEQADKNFEKYIEIDCILIIDNYEFDKEKLGLLYSKGNPIIFIDDYAENKIIANIIINHAEGLSHLNYFQAHYQKLLTGHKYALLRPDFLNKARSARIRNISKVRSCIIMIGGTDPNNYSIKFISYLKQLGIEKLHVVGTQYTSVADVNYHKSLSAIDLIKLIDSVDFAIFPSSTIALEAISCRIPFATGTFVDNQQNIYHGIINQRLAFDLGKFSEVNIEKLSKIINNKNFTELSNEMVKKQSESIDGQSDKRILDELRSLC